MREEVRVVSQDPYLAIQRGRLKVASRGIFFFWLMENLLRPARGIEHEDPINMI